MQTVHPKATDEEIKNISDILKVPVEPVTVNGGIPFLSYGMLANSKSVIVGRPDKRTRVGND